jgi:hypothetical protein
MQLPGEGRGGLLRALQIGSVDLLNIRVGESFRETFGAPVPSIAEQSVGLVGNFIGMAHKKNGAHVLSVRTENKHQRYKEADSRNSCKSSHENRNLDYCSDEVQRIPKIRDG